MIAPEETNQMDIREPYPLRQRLIGLGKTALVSLMGVGMTAVGIEALTEPGVEPKILGTLFGVVGTAMAIAPPVIYYQGDPDISPHRLPHHPIN